MHEADGSEILDPYCVRFFGEQDDACRVEPLKSLGVQCEQAIYGGHDILFYDFQEALKKAPVKPSRPGALCEGMEFMVFFTSSWEKGASSSKRSCGA